MAGYSTSNPPVLLAAAPIHAGAPQIWSYTSGDAIGTVKAADYFSNGAALGMRVGDMVYVYDSATPAASTAWVKTVTAGGAASLSGTVTTLASS